MSQKLNASLRRLEQLEETIEKGLAIFYQVGKALLEIQESRLYLLRFPTFEEYVASRWDVTAARAYQLMSGAKVYDNLRSGDPDCVLPANEAQIRPLASLPKETQQEVWAEVTQKPEPPTAKRIKSTIVERFGTLSPRRTTGDFIFGRAPSAQTDVLIKTNQELEKVEVDNASTVSDCYEYLGRVLSEVLNDSGFRSQTEFAQALKVDDNTVSRIINGNRRIDLFEFIFILRTLNETRKTQSLRPVTIDKFLVPSLRLDRIAG